MADRIETMIRKARDVLPNAYAPYSHYQVAACLCTDDNQFYTGVNVENASYGLTICAEAAAICQMITANKQKIKSLVLLNGADNICSPCGACRQRIAEFSTNETMIYLCNHQSVIKSMTITELLPLAFNFKP
ncbi:cytidine deaminase [Legionella micdadei]|uniref:Cytidine deaminase n=1 Tax=Legionella micdadei TaxID=451 RepID=A0A098GGG7_LEGMI|nr:cytidine deaminase [Legionella micdadei]ARG97429.1 cytidine deaminase [Legionella micdadei]ARH00261.1 cytidine deaminase [Legionella micdadei]KTD28323.1 cytidine deaminase [Legionella micdadei]NSL16951.1 cytidine deaminase [Legionella micdadei]CEG61087.1 Cytidine deaminase [Legionella micdadei]